MQTRIKQQKQTKSRLLFAYRSAHIKNHLTENRKLSVSLSDKIFKKTLENAVRIKIYLNYCLRFFPKFSFMKIQVSERLCSQAELDTPIRANNGLTIFAVTSEIF